MHLAATLLFTQGEFIKCKLTLNTAMTGDQNAMWLTCSNVDSTTSESLPGLGQLYETEWITFSISLPYGRINDSSSSNLMVMRIKNHSQFQMETRLTGHCVGLQCLPYLRSFWVLTASFEYGSLNSNFNKPRRKKVEHWLFRYASEPTQLNGMQQASIMFFLKSRLMLNTSNQLDNIELDRFHSNLFFERWQACLWVRSRGLFMSCLTPVVVEHKRVVWSALNLQVRLLRRPSSSRNALEQQSRRTAFRT